MLTFVKDASATQIVGIYKKSNRSVRPESTVYYTHKSGEDNSNVASAAGVLALHKDSIKKLHKLSNNSFATVAVMLDTDQEPDIGDPLRQAYWEIKKVFERALRNEIFLGDQRDLYMEHNLPRDRSEWGGSFTCIGNSGAGKTYWVVQMLVRYLKATKPHARKTVIWASPEWDIDKTLKPLKDKRFSFSVLGIDVSETALRKSGLDAASYYQTKVNEVLEHGENAIVVLDDFMDAASNLTNLLRKAYNTMLRTARHRNTTVISLVHSYASGKNTSQALQSNKFTVWFPRSQQSRMIMFMRDHLMMNANEAKELVQRFAKLDRWCVIRMHSPVAMYNSKYLLLL